MKAKQTNPDDRLRVEVKSRAELHKWLAKNHARKEAIWLVTWKKGGPVPHLPWPEIVDEALCFGWIDSLPRKLDESRTMLLLSPRRAGSGWSAINKKKAEALIAAGRIAPPGLAAIARAKKDGSWSKLDAANGSGPPRSRKRAPSVLPKPRTWRSATSKQTIRMHAKRLDPRRLLDRVAIACRARSWC